MAAVSALSAVAYLRVAASELPVRETSEPQQRAIEAWAADARAVVTSWHVDVGIDGATPIAERPGLLAALRALRVEGAGALVAANATTFGHEELVTWLIERAALVEGAQLCTADGSTTRTAPEPEDVGYSRGAVEIARAYRRVTVGARVRAVLAAKKARGERIGNLPYGYRLAEDGVHTEPDEREQGVIATVRRLSAEGLSQRAIVARLAASQVVGRTGAPLGVTQVGTILRASR